MPPSNLWLKDLLTSLGIELDSTSLSVINTQIASSQAAVNVQIASTGSVLSALMPLEDGARPTIDLVHKEVHDGHLFSTSYYEKVGAASAVNIMAVTASAGTEIIHFVAEFGTDGPGLFTLSKAPNVDATGGTVLTKFNNNQLSSSTCSIVFTANPSYTSSGTVMATYVIGGSAGVGASKIIIGGDGASRNEWILAGETTYLLRWVADLASCRTVVRTHFYKE